jgi:hypothetical protein
MAKHKPKKEDDDPIVLLGDPSKIDAVRIAVRRAGMEPDEWIGKAIDAVTNGNLNGLAMLELWLGLSVSAYDAAVMNASVLATMCTWAADIDEEKTVN